MKFGTNERARLSLVVTKSQLGAGADGGRAFLTHLLEDTGFRDVVVLEATEAHVPYRVVFPAWVAAVDATWGLQGADIAPELGEASIVDARPAPATPAPRPPKESSPTLVGALVFGAVAVVSSLAAWLFSRRRPRR